MALESRSAREGVEAHRTTRCTVPETAGVTFLRQAIGERTDVIGGIGREDIRLIHQLYRGERRGHRLDGFAARSQTKPVGATML